MPNFLFVALLLSKIIIRNLKYANMASSSNYLRMVAIYVNASILKKEAYVK